MARLVPAKATPPQGSTIQGPSTLRLMSTVVLLKGSPGR